MNIGERETLEYLILVTNIAEEHREPTSHSITLSLSIMHLALRIEYRSVSLLSPSRSSSPPRFQ